MVISRDHGCPVFRRLLKIIKSKKKCGGCLLDTKKMLGPGHLVAPLFESGKSLNYVMRMVLKKDERNMYILTYV